MHRQSGIASPPATRHSPRQCGIGVWDDAFGAETSAPPACNVFHRDKANRENKGEFDEVVKTAWQVLQRGNGKHQAGQDGGQEGLDATD